MARVYKGDQIGNRQLVPEQQPGSLSGIISTNTTLLAGNKHISTGLAAFVFITTGIQLILRSLTPTSSQQ